MNTPSKVTGDSYLATEFTQFSGESKNAILSSGQSLANNDVQLKQAMARYASAGSSFTENGIVNAYNLIAKGSFDLVTTYQDGATYFFTTANANTGNATLSINGLTPKSIKRNGNSLEIFEGEILASEVNIVQYNSGDDSFELINPKIENPVIASYDLAGLSLLDLPHNVSWDAYDYLDFNIIDFETSVSSLVAFACFENSAPSTWLVYAGLLEAWGITGFSFPAGIQSQLYHRISNFSKRKQGEAQYVSCIANLPSYSATRQGGLIYNYGGTTLTTATGILDWAGWDTGTTKFTDHTLRLICNSGTFTTGTLEIRGRNK
jgi:hypothetical protein